MKVPKNDFPSSTRQPLFLRQYWEFLCTEKTVVSNAEARKELFGIRIGWPFRGPSSSCPRFSKVFERSFVSSQPPQKQVAIGEPVHSHVLNNEVTPTQPYKCPCKTHVARPKPMLQLPPASERALEASVKHTRNSPKLPLKVKSSSFPLQACQIHLPNTTTATCLSKIPHLLQALHLRAFLISCVSAAEHLSGVVVWTQARRAAACHFLVRGLLSSSHHAVCHAQEQLRISCHELLPRINSAWRLVKAQHFSTSRSLSQASWQRLADARILGYP